MTMSTGEFNSVVAEPEPPESGSGAAHDIVGRSPSQLAWRRLRHDKVAMTALAVIILIVLFAILAPVLTAIEGQDPYTTHPLMPYLSQGSLDLSGPIPGSPTAAYRFFSLSHWLGIAPQTGRDIFARLAYGAQVSLLIGVLATAVAVLLGTVIGAVAAFFGGVTDTLLSRLMDLLLAFPQLLLALTLTPILQARLGNTFLGRGSTLPIASLVIILGVFGWPYLARIVRGQVLSLREREFVEAARALGAPSGRIIFKEIIPNVIPVVLVYATISIPANITAEAALSFLGAGVRDPTPSWGQMLNEASQSNWYQSDPWVLFVPGVMLLITVLAFNLLGDAVRDALDPKAGRR